MKIAACVGVDLQLALPVVDLQPVETALQFRELGGVGEIVAFGIGSETAADAVKRALAMGADRGIHVVAPPLDALSVARLLDSFGEYDLIVFGTASTEAVRLDVAVGEVLDRPVLSGATMLGIERMPAIVSVSALIGEPRLPTLAGIAGAKSKPFELSQVRNVASLTTVLSERPRAADRRVIDGASGPQEIVAFLDGQGLV